jgi:hypothetical protein
MAVARGRRFDEQRDAQPPARRAKLRMTGGAQVLELRRREQALGAAETEQMGVDGGIVGPRIGKQRIGHGVAPRFVRLIGARRGSSPSDREPLAALGAARSDDGAAAPRLHPDEEAVGALALDDGRLVGALR